MTSFSETVETTAVARQRPAPSSLTERLWPIRHSWIPAIVGVCDVFLIITTAVLTGTLYSYIQGMDADLARHAMTAIVIVAIFVPTLHNRGLYNPAALVNWRSQAR